MVRRTHGEIERDARTAERNSAVDYLRAKASEVEALMDRGAVDRESGGLLVERLRVVARDIDAGLHIKDEGSRS